MEERTSVYIGQHGVDPDRRPVFRRKERMQAGKEESQERSKKKTSTDRQVRTSCGKADAPQHSTTSSFSTPPPPRGQDTNHRDQLQPPSSFVLFLSLPSIARARAHSLSIMDVVAAVSGYISKMVTAGESASGSSSTKMKILLLDSETVGLALD